MHFGKPNLFLKLRIPNMLLIYSKNYIIIIPNKQLKLKDYVNDSNVAVK